MFSIHKIPKISCEPQYSIARLPSNMFNVLSAVDLTEANYYFTTADIDNVTDTDAVYYVVGEDTVQQTPEPCTAPVDVSNKEAVWCSWVEWVESCRNTRAWSYIPTCTIKDPSVMTNGPVKPIDTNDIFTPVPVPTAQVPLAQIQATIKRSRGITEINALSPLYINKKGRKVTIGLNEEATKKMQEGTPVHQSTDRSLTITQSKVDTSTEDVTSWHTVIDFKSNLRIGLDKKKGGGLILNGRYSDGKKAEGATTPSTPHTYIFGFDANKLGAGYLYAGDEGSGITVVDKTTGNPVSANDAKYLIKSDNKGAFPGLIGYYPIIVKKLVNGKWIELGPDQQNWSEYVIDIDDAWKPRAIIGKEPVVVTTTKNTTTVSVEGVLTGIKNNEGVVDFIKLVEEGGVVSLRYGKDFNKLLDPQQIGIEQGEGIIVKQPSDSNKGKYVISLDKSKLPPISLVDDASDYLMVSGHSIGLKPKALTALNSAANMPKPDGRFVTIQDNQLTVVQDNIKKLSPIQSITTPITLDNPITVKQVGTQVTISLNKDMLPKAPIQDVKGDNTFITTNKDDNGVVTVNFESAKVVHTLRVKPDNNGIISANNTKDEVTLTINKEAISALSPIKKIEGGDNINVDGPNTDGVVTLDLTAAGQGVSGLKEGTNVTLEGTKKDGVYTGIVTINGQPGGVTKIESGSNYLSVNPTAGTGEVTISLSNDLEKAIALLSSLANLNGTGIIHKTSNGFELLSTTNSCS